MRNVISYNSWDEKCKAPFGALQKNQGVKIAVTGNDNYFIDSITWVIFKDDVEIERILLNYDESEKAFIGEVDNFLDVGVYFYYFEVNAHIDGYVKKVYYGKSFEDGQSQEFEYGHINKYQITVYEKCDTPSWFKDGILYHIFVDRFNNGNRNGKINNPKRNSFIYANWEDDPMYIKDEQGNISRWDFYGGNLKGIISKLSYLKKLGVSIIYLSPIFEASSNHKYDTGDYKRIDPMFGDEETFKELIDKAKEKGISIILDGVFSHTGDDSKYFNRFGNYSSVGAYQSEDSPYREWYLKDDKTGDYKCWWDVKSLPNTNELEPSFMDYILYEEDSVIKKWTKMGVKGWRLDVADELPTKFIQEMKKELRSVDKDCVLVGEVWEDASNKVSYEERRSYLLGKELDSVMGYPFRKNILDFLKNEINSSQLNNRYMEIKENYPSEAFKSNLNLIGTHDVKRIKTELNEDRDLVKLAVTAQMTFEGVPYIYYGDEAGLIGNTDPDNRRTYPWKNEDEDMIEFYKSITSIRTKNDVLVNGDTEFINTNDDDVFGYIRYNENKKANKIIVLLNRSENNKSIFINTDGDVLEEYVTKNINKVYIENILKENGLFNIEINPKSFAIFEVKENVETN